MMKYRCQNCSYTADSRKFNPAKDLLDRMTPGDTFSDLECPKCGALALEVKEMKIYTVMSDYDGNETFTVEADSLDMAHKEALNSLGWNVCLPDESEE